MLDWNELDDAGMIRMAERMASGKQLPEGVFVKLARMARNCRTSRSFTGAEED